MSASPQFNRFATQWTLPAIILSLIYWIWFGGVVGLDSTIVGFYFFVVFLFFFSKMSRIMATAFSPLFVYLILYTSLKVLHRNNSFAIHIEDLYLFERKLFGIDYNGVCMTVCEYLNLHQSIFLDIFSGVAYVTWVPFPIIFGFILFYNKKYQLLFNFWLCFLIANLLGFIGYITYPAAAPWYYLEYGNALIDNAPSSAAGLLRFDELINFPLYANMYSKGTNTFGAMPSMHAAFPLILVYFCNKFGNKILTAIFFVSLLGIWFGAVYSNHHYIVDVIAGIVCGIMAIYLTESIVNRKFVLNWYQKTMDYISLS
jgi:hypothetical protein